MMAVKVKQPYEMNAEELLALYTEFEQLPRHGRQAWMKQKGYYDSTFYTQRKKWLGEHPEFQLSEYSKAALARSQKGLRARYGKQKKQRVTVRSMKEQQRKHMAHARAVLAEKRKQGLIGPSGSQPTVRLTRDQAFDFQQASDSGKRAMLEQYKQLSQYEKKAFRESHNMPQHYVFKYSKRFGIDAFPEPAPRRTPIPAGDDSQAYLDEYLHLLGNGEKGEWLKRHGLKHQHVFEVKKGIRTSFYNIKSFVPDPNRRALVPAQRPQKDKPLLIDVDFTQAPARQEPSLSDVIAAMEVKRDQLNAFIEDLKRMQRGAR